MNHMAEAVSEIVEVLKNFETEDRSRIVKASLTLLGDDFSSPINQAQLSKSSGQNNDNESTEMSEVNALAKPWLRKSGIEKTQLEDFFHFDEGKVNPIALPGNAKSKKDLTVNVYLTIGLARYLEAGIAAFSDTDARKLCEQFGCYDTANHALTLKSFGNKIAGSKSAGWKLTTPGLTCIADLVKQSKI